MPQNDSVFGKGKKVPEMRLSRETPKVPDTPNERLVELLNEAAAIAGVRSETPLSHLTTFHVALPDGSHLTTLGVIR